MLGVSQALVIPGSSPGAYWEYLRPHRLLGPPHSGHHGSKHLCPGHGQNPSKKRLIVVPKLAEEHGSSELSSGENSVPGTLKVAH